MDSIITLLEKLVPWVISLLSVCVAMAAVWMNKRLSYRQALYDRKAQVYKHFFEAFANMAFDPSNSDKRAALSNAFNCAILFSSREVAWGLNFVVEHAMSAKDRSDIAAIDEIVPDLRDEISRDLSNTWTLPLRKLQENFVLPQKQKSQDDSGDQKQ